MGKPLVMSESNLGPTSGMVLPTKNLPVDMDPGITLYTGKATS